MKSVLVFFVALVASAAHVRGACVAVRAIAAGVPPVEAVKMTESQVEAISPLAEDGSFKAGMKDVMSVLDATCEANVLQALEEQANLYLAAMDDPSVQNLTFRLMTRQYENDPNAQHLMLIVPTDNALNQLGITSPEDLKKYGGALPLILGETVFDSHQLNAKPSGPIDLYPVVKGLADGKEDPAYPLAALATVELALANVNASLPGGIEAAIKQYPETLEMFLKDDEDLSALEALTVTFACNSGVSVVILDDVVKPKGIVLQPLDDVAIPTTGVIGPAAAPQPAPTPVPKPISPVPIPTPKPETPPVAPSSAAISLSLGAAAVAAATAIVTLF